MKRQTNYLQKALMLIALTGWAMTATAQRYENNHGRVYYGHEDVMQADPRTFVDLGYGYAKDYQHVYLNGRILEYVDPTTFRLKEPVGPGRHGTTDEAPMMHHGYYKTKFAVYYADHKIDASASSFKELGQGYAKDAFNVYYFGRKVEGAMASSFKLLQDGYAKDSFNVFYYGVKVEGAVASSFHVSHDGYAEDNWNAYYRGRKLK